MALSLLLSTLVQLLILVILGVSAWIQHRKRAHTLLARNGIPSEPVDDILWGNMRTMMKGSGTPVINQWHSKYGRIFGYYLGSKAKVVVSDLELLSRIQIKQFNHFVQRTIFNVVGGFELWPQYEKSLISDRISDTRWKEQRSLLSSAFSSAKLKSAVPLVNDAIVTMMNLLEQQRTEDPENQFNMHKVFQGLTMDSIGRSAFGVQTKAQENPDDPFFASVRRVFESHLTKITALPFMADLLLPEFTLLWYPLRRIQWIILRALGMSNEAIQVSVIRSIMKKRMTDNSSLKKDEFAGHDLLQQMIDANVEDSEVKPTGEEQVRRVHKMSSDEIVSNSMLFFDAGYETTSTLLTFLAHVLVSYPDVQTRVRRELIESLAGEDTIGYNALTGLPYLDAVINETLRFYPPITMFVTRRGTVDLIAGDICIPKGTVILVPVYVLHHDAEYWSEPETFDPERWLGERKKQIKPLAFQPFGAGPRNCIGMRFALLEVKMAVANLLLKYELKACAKTQLAQDLELQWKPISLVPKHGVFVKLQPL